MAVRRERVILELQDSFSAEMMKAAAATALLNRELNQLDGQSARLNQSSLRATRAIDTIGSSANNSGRAIDRFSGRLGLAIDAMLTLGPAAVAMTAMAVPAVMTLSTGMAAIGVAAIGTVVAFGGVGEALKKMNEAHLEPTVENLQEAEEAMKRLAPAAQEFVEKLDSLRGLGGQIRDAGAEALFLGLVDALDSLATRGPDAVRIIEKINREVGDIARDGAASLASERWDDFFALIEDEAPDALDSMARALGDVTHGVSELFEAFTPMSKGGLSWIEDAADDFDKWATSLSKTEGFKEFSEYIAKNGPAVASTLASLVDMLIAVGEAMAPFSDEALAAVEGIADAIAAIARSEIGSDLLLAAGAMRMMARFGPAAAASAAAITGATAGGAAAGVVGKGGKGGKGILSGAKKTPIAIPIAATAIVSWTMENNEVGKFFNGLGAKAGAATGADAFLPWLEREIKIMLGIEVDEKGAANAFSWVDGEIKRLNGQTAKPKLDIDDKNARDKQRQATDWLFEFGRRDEAADIRLEDRQRRKASADADHWLNDFGSSVATAKANTDNGQALGAIGTARAALAALDGKTATTYIRTERINVTTDLYRKGYDTIGGLQRSADGGTVPRTGMHYADRHPYLLADGEEVISNRYGQADRHRDLLKAINSGRLADGGTAGRSASAGHGMAPQVSLAGLTLRANVDGLGDVMFRVAEETVAADHRTRNRDTRTRTRAGL